MPQPPPPTKVQKQLKWNVILWVLVAVFSVLLFLYFYQVLIADYPIVGRLLPSPSDANLIVAVLSQIFGQLIQALFKDFFDILRWQLASREQGVSIPTFLSLGGGTTWLGLLLLGAIKGSHHVWAFYR